MRCWRGFGQAETGRATGRLAETPQDATAREEGAKNPVRTAPGLEVALRCPGSDDRIGIGVFECGGDGSVVVAEQSVSQPWS